MTIPNIPIATIPAPTSTSLDDLTNLYPQLEGIVRGEPVEPGVSNRQPRALDRRTESLRDRVNKVIGSINSLRDNLLSRDGATVSSSMRGPLSMITGSSRYRVTDVADGSASGDAVNKGQLDVVHLILTNLTTLLGTAILADGSRAMTGDLNLDGNRAINVDTPVNFSDLVNLQYATTQLDAVRTGHLPRDGSLPMLADLNMAGHRITGLPVVGYPTQPNQAATKVYVDALSASISQAPSGSFFPYGGVQSTVPTGWLLCDGRIFLTSDYLPLFQVFGYTYGGSGGSFRIPDFRGRTVVGLDNLGGVSAGRLTDPQASILGGVFGQEYVTLTEPNLPAHAHGYTDTYVADGVGTAVGPVSTNTTSRLVTLNKTTSPTGSGVAHYNVQPSIAVNWIVKT